MSTVFISDLHLSPNDRELMGHFEFFLENLLLMLAELYQDSKTFLPLQLVDAVISIYQDLEKKFTNIMKLNKGDMPDIEILSEPELIQPTVIAAFSGWSDAGEAATSALRFLSRRWKALISIFSSNGNDVSAFIPSDENEKFGPS